MKWLDMEWKGYVVCLGYYFKEEVEIICCLLAKEFIYPCWGGGGGGVGDGVWGKVS